MKKQEEKLIADLREFNLVNWTFFFNESPRRNIDLADLMKTSIKQSRSILAQFERMESKFRSAHQAERKKAILAYEKKLLKTFKPKK